MQKWPCVQNLHRVAPSSSWYLPASHWSHDAWPAAAVKVPAAHRVSSKLPVGLNKPALVIEHSAALVRSVLSPYVPALHGRGAAAPSGQKEPLTHALHAVAPSPFSYLPGAHFLHVCCSGSSLYVPALHGVGTELPTGQKEPLLHTSQSSTLVMRIPTGRTVPPGHGNGVEALSGQYEPRAHGLHSVDPRASW